MNTPSVRSLASNSGWIGRLIAVRNGQNQHSLYLVGAGIILTITLLIDLVFHRDDFKPALLIPLIVVAGTATAVIAVFGRRVPLWVGHVGVGFFVLASLIFVSPLMSTQPAVSTMQEFPLIALYVSWFVAVRYTRWVMLVITLGFGLVMLVNPVFWFNGELGAASAVQSLVLLWICFECGLALRKRTTLRVSIDQLTGALNRNGFLKSLTAAVSRAERRGAPLSLVVFDFDDFKQLNDSQGHAAGDLALQRTVTHWQNNLRPKDQVGRTGGDEFAVYLEGTDASAAQQIVQRIRSDSPHPFSWGISQARPSDSVDQLFLRADNILYQFKRRRHRAQQ